MHDETFFLISNICKEKMKITQTWANEENNNQTNLYILICVVKNLRTLGMSWVAIESSVGLSESTQQSAEVPYNMTESI